MESVIISTQYSSKKKYIYTDVAKNKKYAGYSISQV